MKRVRFFCFMLPAVLGCTVGRIDLGDPGRDETPRNNAGGDDDGSVGRQGDPRQDPGSGHPGPTTSSDAAETVVEGATLAQVGEIRDFELAGGKLYYSAFNDDRVSLYRYDIASKANVLIDGVYGGSPFAADAGGFFYYGITSDRKAVIGIPLMSTTHAAEWFSPVMTYATAVALDQQKVYWVERGELTTSFRIANRGAFASPPSQTAAFGPSIDNNGGEHFTHLVIDQGVGYAAGDRGTLVKFDLEIARTLLATGGPKNGFVVDASSLYWVDGTDLKSLSKSAAPGTAPSVIAPLPSEAANFIGGVGPKGIYVLSQPSAGGDSGKVLRIHPTNPTPTELATKLTGLRGGTFLDKSLYFVTSEGLLRLRDE